jgi:HK97 family phage major capsid protein
MHGFLSHLHSLMVTMSQKSSVPQTAKSVSQALMSDKGIMVPDQVFHVERRTLLVGSSAADLMPAGHRADLFIDQLKATLVTAALGATYIDGLVGSPIDIPRQTGSSTAQWVDEDGSLSETDPSFDDVTFTPKTVGAVTSMSRRTILNTSPSIETIVRNMLMSTVASSIDVKALIGDGQNNTPTGVTNAGATPGGGGAALTWEEILAFPALVEGDNALQGSLGWAINPFVIKKLRSTAKVSSTDSVMIMESHDQLAGYKAVSTTALPGSAPGATRHPAP